MLWSTAKADPSLLFAPAKSSELEPHAATVADVAFSPFEKRFLLSAAMDGAIKLFDVMSQRPLFTLYPPTHGQSVGNCALSSCSWSHGRPLVFQQNQF